jgi:hypothetical protein
MAGVEYKPDKPPLPPPIQTPPVISSPSIEHPTVARSSIPTEANAPDTRELFRWLRLLCLVATAAGTFLIWGISIGSVPGNVVKLHYMSLFIGSAAVTLLALERFVDRPLASWIGAAVIGAVACAVWYQFDSYKVVSFITEQHTGVVTYDRAGVPRSEALHFKDPFGISQGPVDELGARHGKWETRFFGKFGLIQNEWYFHGKEVSAMEYQAMARD